MADDWEPPLCKDWLETTRLAVNMARGCQTRSDELVASKRIRALYAKNAHLKDQPHDQ